METRNMKRKARLLSLSTSIPEELIVVEILPRIDSVKSLLRFKCVSKSWCSLISSKNFAKTQLLKSVNDLSQLTAFFVSSTENDFAINHCPVDDMINQRHINVTQFEFKYKKDYVSSRVGLVGCCNGLCCILVDENYFVLLNPFTRKSYALPNVYVGKQDQLRTYGFGYDESNDDYKVLAKSYGGCVRLYSLRTDSWKTVDEFFSTHFSGGDGVLVNGKLHWKSSTNLEIVSFDLGNEAMGVVELPSSQDGNPNYWQLDVLKGCLCVCVSRDYYKDGIDVWVMKEYGVTNSWSRVVTLLKIYPRYDHVEILDVRKSFPRYRYFMLPNPVYISEEGKILVFGDSVRCIYNPKTKNVRCLEIKKVHKIDGIGICTNSLISPFPGVELEPDYLVE